jgi:hypothetical protein
MIFFYQRRKDQSEIIIFLKYSTPICKESLKISNAVIRTITDDAMAKRKWPKRQTMVISTID